MADSQAGLVECVMAGRFWKNPWWWPAFAALVVSGIFFASIPPRKEPPDIEKLSFQERYELVEKGMAEWQVEKFLGKADSSLSSGGGYPKQSYWRKPEGEAIIHFDVYDGPPRVTGKIFKPLKTKGK